MNLFLIDSNNKTRDSLTGELRARGHSVTALNGVAALASALGTFACDAIVLAIEAGGEPGLDLVRRTREGGGPLPLIVVSERATVTDRVKALGLGADDVLVKPYHLDELLARLQAKTRAQPAA